MGKHHIFYSASHLNDVDVHLPTVYIEEVIGDAEFPGKVAPDSLTGDGFADLSGLGLDIPLRVVPKE